MKEIKIKINRDILNVVNEIMLHLDFPQNSGQSIKAAYSLCQVLSKKLRKKAIDKETTDKEFTLKLEYHYAYSLYFVLNDNIGRISSSNVYERTKMQELINNLSIQL